jgi:hypothetical protein
MDGGLIADVRKFWAFYGVEVKTNIFSYDREFGMALFPSNKTKPHAVRCWRIWPPPDNHCSHEIAACHEGMRKRWRRKIKKWERKLAG